MSSSEAPAATTTTDRVTQAVQATEGASIVPEAAATSATDAVEASVAPDATAPAAPLTEAPAPEAVESTPVTEDAKHDEDKKEKKHTRKPFADLLSKILKPHPHEKPAVEKKEMADPNVPAPHDLSAAPVSAPEAPVENPEVAVEASADGLAAEEAPKDTASPRKERGNIFEKLTALVMKPKSPKLKKSDAPKDETDEIPAVEGNTEAPTAEDATPALPEPVTAVEVAETTADVPVPSETPEEPKTEKKEKTPKDLAKLARRFSGRLFGVEKKKESAKRPEVTPEEAEGALHSETPAAAAALDVAPQITGDAASAEPTAETPQSAADSAPVIAAAA